MAWWDHMDEDFVAFLGNLFAPQAASRDASGRAIMDSVGKPISVVDKITDEHHATATATGKPSPVASPSQGPAPWPINQYSKSPTSPSPTTSPTASPSGAIPSPLATSPSPNPASALKKGFNKSLEETRALFARMGAEENRKSLDLNNDSLVYDGKVKNIKSTVVNDDGKRVAYGQGAENLRTLGDVSLDVYRWDEDQVKKINALMVDAGYDTSNADRRKMAAIWVGFAQTSAYMWKVGKKMSPMDILKRQSYGLSAATPKTTTSTSTQYTVTNALNAEQLAHAALSQRLGRSATEAEVVEFKKALAAAEKADPTSTTTTQTTDAKGNSTSSSTTKQGVSSTDVAVDWSWEHNKDEARAYQAAGIMMPWFFDALKAPV